MMAMWRVPHFQRYKHFAGRNFEWAQAHATVQASGQTQSGGAVIVTCPSDSVTCVVVGVELSCPAVQQHGSAGTLDSWKEYDKGFSVSPLQPRHSNCDRFALSTAAWTSTRSPLRAVTNS